MSFSYGVFMRVIRYRYRIHIRQRTHAEKCEVRFVRGWRIHCAISAIFGRFGAARGTATMASDAGRCKCF